MIEWIVVLTPLLVLPIILLFRFVGCGATPDDDIAVTTPFQPPAPSVTLPAEETIAYSDYIVGKSPDKAYVMHYWRLVDPPDPPMPAGVDTHPAADMSTLQPQNGQYRRVALPVVTAQPNATPPIAGSEGRDPAKFDEGTKSLIVTDPPETKGRHFNGGHVRVLDYGGLYTEQFTIEAWVDLSIAQAKYEYTLFSAGYVYGTPTSLQPQRGFRVFVDRNTRWQARLARVVQNPTDQNPAFKDLFSKPAPAMPGTTHIAFTVDNVSKKVARLYINGAPVSPGDVPVDSYARPDGFALFIGVGNAALTPTAEALRTPMLARIQEVVLYRVALSEPEIVKHHKINTP